MAISVRSQSIGSATAPTISVTKPSGVVEGDVLIAVYFGDSGLSGVSASGWTTMASRNPDDELATRVWRRTATGGEGTNFSFSQPVNADGIVHIICVRDASTTIPPKVATVITFAGEVVTPPVTAASATHLEIRAGAITGGITGTVTWTPPPGYALRGSRQSGDLLTSAAASKQIASSTSTGAKSFTLSLPAGERYGVGVSISLAEGDAGPAPEPPPPFTPGRGSALYRYVLRRWDGTYLDDLDLRGVSLDKRILQPGTFSATIPIPSRKVAARVARVIPRDEEGVGGITDLSIGPGVITCEVYRGGVCWGEYWITATQLSRSRRGTPAIQLRGSTMDAYLLHVELQEALEFVSEDQIDIARSLLQHMQGQPHASLNLALQSGSSGVPQDRTYAANEATYGQRLTELAQVESGFEWAINIVAGPAGLERHWVWGYPTLGSDAVAHVFVDSPNGGDILELGEQVDALRGATSWRARGSSISTDASTSSVPLMSDPHVAEAHLAAGWPRIDRTLTYSSVIEQQTLEDYAAYWAATAPGALRVDSITVALGAEPTFTPNSLGDQARIFLNNEWHLPHSRVRRIIGIGVTPTSRESGKEEADLIFEGIEVTGG
ncbi:hypothetical protein OG884_18890 [Streptosporangium sp. NBC_01755]|uniref:hypothetical protein n=1 Tax=Streptosporangium sp. NBC_01755 TaxID=2975949 RepID=UPI002DD88335|nr:hypothetical protein [Streptosporangium sp. NBC_01755]WSD03876.1 hypothetical protein OG884_18890 [Streptosporangium sp. NBC_01755]